MRESRHPLKMSLAMDVDDVAGREYEFEHEQEYEYEYEYEPVDNEDGVGVGTMVSGTDNKTLNSKSKRKLIQISSQIELPFSAEVAYEAYSDLSRQPTWSSWLESVVVLNDGSSSNSNNNNNSGKVESKWTSKMMGIRYSWTAEAVRNERPHTIQWKSVTGLRNEGTVRFYPRRGKGYDKGPTLMTLNMAFVTPRAVTSIVKRSKKLSKFVEEKMIAESLQQFRDTVVSENNLQNENEDGNENGNIIESNTKTESPRLR